MPQKKNRKEREISDDLVKIVMNYLKDQKIDHSIVHVMVIEQKKGNIYGGFIKDKDADMTANMAALGVFQRIFDSITISEK